MVDMRFLPVEVLEGLWKTFQKVWQASGVRTRLLSAGHEPVLQKARIFWPMRPTGFEPTPVTLPQHHDCLAKTIQNFEFKQPQTPFSSPKPIQNLEFIQPLYTAPGVHQSISLGLAIVHLALPRPSLHLANHHWDCQFRGTARPHYNGEGVECEWSMLSPPQHHGTSMGAGHRQASLNFPSMFQKDLKYQGLSLKLKYNMNFEDGGGDLVLENQRQVLWIWTLAGTEGTDRGLENALRVKWSKAFARKRRWEEEVRLLEEEYRREAHAAAVRVGVIAHADAEAAVAYAMRHADMYRDLKSRGEATWTALKLPRGKKQACYVPVVVKAMEAEAMAESGVGETTETTTQPDGGDKGGSDEEDILHGDSSDEEYIMGGEGDD
ncbi:hypothetical protein B0H19DRAFT_1075170 [Mycena capillaripes]|nr:hypothetical protein B0H19DRAFT_1075170 [Mycena capillaripes]